VTRLGYAARLLCSAAVSDPAMPLHGVVDVLRRRGGRNLPDQIRIATVYYKPARNRSALVPDFYVRTTDQWLVFPHELEGLTREEILAHRPVDESFFENR
jgi:hypothetical protein